MTAQGSHSKASSPTVIWWASLRIADQMADLIAPLISSASDDEVAPVLVRAEVIVGDAELPAVLSTAALLV